MESSEQNRVCRIVVHQAQHLIAKGADGTWSNAFVKMTCEKERFVTTVAEKSPNPQWHEDCEFCSIHDESCVELMVYHRGKVLDDFLGRVSIPVGELHGSSPLSTKWYKLQQRLGKTKKDSKERGEIEVSVEVTDEHVDSSSIGVELEASDVNGQVGTSKVKKPSTLRAKTGLKSKLKASRLKSYIAVSKEERTSPENSFAGREKSDSNDSGRASDSIASESPASMKRLSHEGQGNVFGSQDSVVSSSSHSKEKKAWLKKRVKNAIGSLKKDKNKDSVTASPYSSASCLTSPPSDTHPPKPTDAPPDASPRPRPSDHNPTHRNRILSDSEIETGRAKATRPLSYPLRAISEEYIPLEALYSNHNDPHPWRKGARPAEEPESRKQLDDDHENSEQYSSKDNKLRHSFRSGLPSLRKTTVNVTFDPASENGYRTGGKDAQGATQFPAQYVKMTKEELICRLLLKERLLRECQQYVRELEDYTDNLLLKVMLESPRLLDRDYFLRGIRSTL